MRLCAHQLYNVGKQYKNSFISDYKRPQKMVHTHVDGTILFENLMSILLCHTFARIKSVKYWGFIY